VQELIAAQSEREANEGVARQAGLDPDSNVMHEPLLGLKSNSDEIDEGYRGRNLLFCPIRRLLPFDDIE
jgi:hypothetical protein